MKLPHLFRHPRALLLAGAIPFATVVAGLLAYNCARFGMPLEFGNRLQLTDTDYRSLRMLSLEFLPGRLRDYILTPFGFSPYFPFITNGHDTLPVGLLWTCPFSVCKRPVGDLIAG